jgi:hypothetical protein
MKRTHWHVRPIRPIGSQMKKAGGRYMRHDASKYQGKTVEKSQMKE